MREGRKCVIEERVRGRERRGIGERWASSLGMVVGKAVGRKQGGFISRVKKIIARRGGKGKARTVLPVLSFPQLSSLHTGSERMIIRESSVAAQERERKENNTAKCDQKGREDSGMSRGVWVR